MNTRKCSHCQMVKSLDKFTKNRAYKDGTGLDNNCKICKKKLYDKWRLNNIEKVRKYHRDYQSKLGKENPEILAERTRKFRAKKGNFIKKYDRAHRMVAYAIKKNNLKKETCAICDSPNTNAHHEDYDYPLDVIWLCAVHHRNIEKIKADVIKELQKV